MSLFAISNKNLNKNKIKLQSLNKNREKGIIFVMHKMYKVDCVTSFKI